MFEFIAEYWGILSATALGFMWIGQVENRVKRIEMKQKEDPPMTESMCKFKHLSDEKMNLLGDKVFEDRLSALEGKIDDNDKKMRALIEARHNDLVFMIEKLYDRKP